MARTGRSADVTPKDQADVREVKDLLRRATDGDPYEAFEYGYRALVVAAHRSTLDRENARVQRLVGDLPEQVVRQALGLAAVDVILELDPPLESFSEFETEDLSTEHVAKSLRQVSCFRETRPSKAIRALVEVLGFIRGKQVHGYKRVFHDRDYVILQAAAAITHCLGQGAVVVIEE